MTHFQMPPGVFSMTPRQAECLQIICEWIDEHGSPPSFRALASELENESTFGAYWLTCELEERGWIRTGGLRKKIEVLHRPPMPDFSEIEWSLAPDLVAAPEPSGGVER